jgi:hypothetical protein
MSDPSSHGKPARRIAANIANLPVILTRPLNPNGMRPARLDFFKKLPAAP